MVVRCVARYHLSLHAASSDALPTDEQLANTETVLIDEVCVKRIHSICST